MVQTKTALITNLLLFWYFLRGKNLKIHEQTQNKLNFTIQPKWYRFVGVFIGQVGIIYLFAIVVIIPVTQLNCDRVAQNLEASIIEEKSSSNPTRHLQTQEWRLSHLVNRFAY